MKIRTILKWVMVAVVAFSFNNMYAQPAGMYEHGSNSGGVDPNEDTDSVTIGASMNYFVMPDLTINQDGDGPYDYTTNADALVSTFDWTGSTIGTLAGPDTDNEVSFTFGSLGTGLIRVVEQGPSCASGDTTDVPVRVIAVPTAVFDAPAGAICESDTASGYDVDITSTTSMTTGLVRYIIEVEGPNTNVTHTATVNIAAGTNTYTIPAGSFGDGRGAYTISFTEVSDRISRKSSVAGSLASTHTMTLNGTPTTGKIYHVPNR